MNCNYVGQDNSDLVLCQLHMSLFLQSGKLGKCDYNLFIIAFFTFFANSESVK